MPSQTERLQKRLENTHTFSMRLLEDFNTPEEWTRQLHEGGNHAIWFIGHMGTTDNFMISVLSPKRSESAGELGDKFGMGSQPSSKSTDHGSRTIPAALRFEVFRRDSFTCTYCGRTPAEVRLHADHLVPWSQGGPSTPENLRTACSDCNLGKGARRLH